MKKLLLMLLVVLSCIQVFAGMRPSMLKIRDERGRTISITIDGRKYNKINRTLTVGDLPSGMHNIKIFVYNSNGYGYRNGILLYQGKIMTKPGMIYYCTASKNTLDIEENCCIDDYGKWNDNDNFDMWDDERDTWNNNQKWHNNRDYDDRDNRDYNNSWKNHNDNDKWNNNSNNRPDNRGDKYDDNNWNSYQGVISNGRYDQLIDQIRKTNFESSKVNVAKQALKNNDITVNQLVGILREFTFESSKLDFVKENYSKIVDKKNIYLVNDVFTFDSSKDDLAEFLNRQPR